MLPVILRSGNKKGRAVRGSPIFGAISKLRYAQESFIAAKIESRIFAPFCYKGTCNSKLFNFWLTHFLILELKPGQVVIMDNATFHKSEESQRLIKETSCRILCLPIYSPDLNPIEILWANFKKMI